MNFQQALDKAILKESLKIGARQTLGKEVTVVDYDKDIDMYVLKDSDGKLYNSNFQNNVYTLVERD